MKRIIVLGSTGSIGRSSLEVVRGNSHCFEIVGLSGNRNIDLLKQQIQEFHPKYVTVGYWEAYQELKILFPKIQFFCGEEGLEELASVEEYDILLTAVSGAVGIRATIKGIEKEKRIALANKETMVSAGSYINRLLQQYPKAEIIPVDSEHSAIFQALQGNEKKEVKRLIITASGGAFRGKTKAELEDVRVEDALKHPNWSMGKKITVDSATLVNKGLEIIEAHELFGFHYDSIDTILHPQSIVHSMVEYQDHSIMAQMGVTDMKLPIQYAFSYPKHLENPVLEALDFTKYMEMTFEPINTEVFQGIPLARKAGSLGGSMPIVFNAANEIAVDYFLKEKIRFLEIYEMIQAAMERFPKEDIQSLEQILDKDHEVREWGKTWGKSS
ncbi:1-deoxy-D-xylulose-5-phosphate reductoisomerase [Fusobacterium necrophorum]|uniref:1-deoxy-D-xylulose 5-phosphate reductoisomerase n=1 Tax=Fusobacterium necrophorum TaxID=859 RepID=A0A4Q2L389_9FUSO|nr:1-deoxy-D-xylulose-5-phosphate reductoisomerase [Fusobacterium necrophorum]RXZ70521.1 1-deoxy-D-xylulose-5-phosphate reductoisomerase [Fusobacterium necrophorum]